LAVDVIIAEACFGSFLALAASRGKRTCIRLVQERPQDFGYGVNAHLPPEAKNILKI